MINVNFSAYGNYVTDSVYQWDLNQALKVTGLNIGVVPEVHFANADMDRAIVRQGDLVDGVITVMIPNSILQYPLPIYAYIGIYSGSTFKVIETVRIPVRPRTKPTSYQIEDNDGEVYSFKALENALANANNATATNTEKVNVLNARVDNLVKYDGSDDAGVELADGRVDFEGTTYGATGEATRGADAKLKHHIGGAVKGTFTCNPDLFENGSWNHNDVKSNGEVYRVRTKEAISFPYDVKISIADGFNIRGYWCDEAGKSITHFNWTTTPFTVEAGQKFKIIIAKVTENTGETADIAEFVNAVIVKSGMRLEVDDLKNNINNLTVESFGFNAEDFTPGWIAGWDNGIFNPNAKSRVATPDVMRFPYDVVIRAKDGFRFALNYWNDGEFVSDELWQTEYYVPAGQDFKIMIGRVTEDDSEIADVEWFVSQIYIVSGLKNHMTKLDELEEKIHPLPPTPRELRSVNHRGYNTVAPENTLPAFRLSKEKGFNFVETDVRFTSDGVPVLLHDATINRTGRNADGSVIDTEINISDITLDEVLTYDFGIYKSQDYAGTKIPTFAQFCNMCARLELHPYIEIEGEIDGRKASLLITYAKIAGILDNVTWISFTYESLLRIVEQYPTARVGLNCITEGQLTATQKKYLEKLLTMTNNVFLHVDTNIDNTVVNDAIDYGVPLEIWCPNTESEILALNPYITGVTTDKLIAKDVVSGNRRLKPVEKTEAMTVPVGVDEDGKLYAEPIGGDSNDIASFIPNIKSIAYNPVIIYAGELSTGYGFACSFNAGIIDPDDIIPPIYRGYGKYTNEYGDYIINVDFKLQISDSIGADGSITRFMSLVPTIPEPMDLDLEITLYANYQFYRHAM